MAGLVGIYKDLIDEIITECKTITGLEDGTDLQGETVTRVFKYNKSRNPEKNTYEAEVKAAQMEVEGFSTYSSDNTFNIIIDLIHYADEYDVGADNVLTVAEKIYDKMHLTSLNGKCRVAYVQLYPGDGEFADQSLLAIPIRIIVTCKRVVHQR